MKSINKPELELPKPTGCFAIGSSRRLVVDNKSRPLPARIWYPACQPTVAPLCSFLEPLEVQAVRHRILRNVPTDFLRKISTHSYEDAAPIPSKFPVLFYVHGLGGLSGTNQVLIEDVVSHGHIVIGLSHPGDSLVTLYPDKTAIHRVNEPKMGLVARTAWLDQLAQRWAQDITTAIDYFLSQENSKEPVYASCDFEQRGILGYSLGGAVARIVCSDDTAMRFGINIDGTYYGRAPDAPTACNFMAIESDLSTHDTESEELKLHFQRRTASWKAIGGETTRIIVSNASHTTFSDFTLVSEYFSEEIGSSIGYRRCSALVNAHVVAFVQEHFDNAAQ